MKHTLMLAALTLTSLGTVGCIEAVGCDFRGGSLNGPENRCQERRNLQAAPFGPACEASGGEVVEGGCPTEGIVGGCEIAGGGGDVVDFYYDIDEDELASECGSDTVIPAP